jgi:hypothetical protein
MNSRFISKQELADLIAESYRRPSWAEYVRGLPWILPAVVGGWLDRLFLRHPQPVTPADVEHFRAVIEELSEACYALKSTHTEWANAEEIALALDQADLAVDRAERVLAGKAVPR